MQLYPQLWRISTTSFWSWLAVQSFRECLYEILCLYSYLFFAHRQIPIIQALSPCIKSSMSVILREAIYFAHIIVTVIEVSLLLFHNTASSQLKLTCSGKPQLSAKWLKASSTIGRLNDTSLRCALSYCVALSHPRMPCCMTRPRKWVEGLVCFQ